MRYVVLFGAILSLVVCASTATVASADTLSATGGLTFGRNSGLNNLNSSNPMIGAQYTFGLARQFELGGFYDYHLLSFADGHSGSITFMGMTLRLQMNDNTKAGPFLETKLGVAQRTEINVQSSSIPALGVGAGYRIPLSKVTSLSPRVELDYLPDSTDQNPARQAFLSFAMMLSFHI